MKRATTLKENYEFRRVYNKGKSGVSPFLVVYARPNRGSRNRLGVTVSAKLGHAVVRNRVRRRLREIYRLSQPEMKQGYDIVLVARGRAVRASYQELASAYRRICKKLELLEAAK
jgi:ribonuclease P protein component